MIDSLFLNIVATDTAAEGGGSSPLLLMVMLALLLLLLFTTFRRGRKVRQAQQEAHAGAVVGAEVVTAGGIVGVIVARDEEKQRLTLEFSTGDRMDVLLGAVQQITSPAVSSTEHQPESLDTPDAPEYGSPDDDGSSDKR